MGNTDFYFIFAFIVASLFHTIFNIRVGQKYILLLSLYMGYIMMLWKWRPRYVLRTFSI